MIGCLYSEHFVHVYDLLKIIIISAIEYIKILLLSINLSYFSNTWYILLNNKDAIVYTFYFVPSQDVTPHVK